MSPPESTPASPDYADLAERYARLEMLYQVSTVIHSTLDPQEALQLIIQQALRLTRGTSGSVVLINPHTHFLEIQAGCGLPDQADRLRLKVGEGITGWVARTGRAALVNDVRQDDRYIMVQEKTRSELAVPVEVGGETRGVINVDSDRLSAFTPEDLELLSQVALQAAVVIQNTWLYEQNRMKARLFETLVKVGQIINSTVNVDDALQSITREARQLMQARLCSLMLLDSSGEWLDLRSSSGASEGYINKPRLRLEESLLGVVVRRKKSLHVANVQVSGGYQSIEVARTEGLVSLLSVPLVFGEEVLGTLNVYTGELYNFSNEEIQALSALAQLSAVALEKARLYERIVDVEEELRQNEKLSSLGILAAEVAHEIRNPLTVIKMLYHSLDLQFPPGDPRGEDVRIMGDKMEHLNKIVEKILDFARSAEPHWSPVSLNESIHGLSLLIRHKLSHHGVGLQLELHPQLPLIQADPGQLEQVFLNLALNAVEAMEHGGHLILRTGILEGDRVSVEVIDTGEGMSTEQQERLFSSLLQSTKQKGTGLGLAVVKRIIDAHHGEICVESALGRGTTIRILLPLICS